MKTDFHRILREKMEAHKIKFAESTPPSSETTEPLHLAFLLGKINKTQLHFKGTYRHNPSDNKETRPFSHDKNNISEDLTPPIPPHFLSEKQKMGWLWFWKKGAPLQANYSQSELQKQFRKLAQVMHPDKNLHPKAAEAFITLREHYESLLSRCA